MFIVLSSWQAIAKVHSDHMMNTTMLIYYDANSRSSTTG